VLARFQQAPTAPSDGARNVVGAGDELPLRHCDHADDDAATIAFVPPGDTTPAIAKMS
jgi:hypothetical protein